MKALLNQMSRQSQQAGAGVTGTRQGTVTAYDPNTYSVKVQLQPTGEETGWIPLSTPWVGNGWGVAAGPMIGAVISVEFDSGNASNGMAVGQFFNDIDRSPGPPSGEFWVIHKSGSLLKFTNDGQVLVTAQTNAVYTAQLHHFIGPVQMDNTLTVTQSTAMNGGFTAQNGADAAGVITGDVTATGTITGTTDVIAAGKSGKSHNHHENGAGGNTNPPN